MTTHNDRDYDEKEKDNITMLWEAVIDLQKRVKRLERKLLKEEEEKRRVEKLDFLF